MLEIGNNAERNTLTINSKDVPVIVGDNVIERIIEISQKYDRVVLIAGSDCLDKFSKHIPDLSGIRGEFTKITLNYDENLKNIRNYQKIIRVMIERNISTDSLLIGLGGPAVCDISGFISSTFRGGIDYVPVPSTPLAQVSNAISGTNGINFSSYEDAMSTRYTPKEVEIDTHFTRNSDSDELRDAITDILRYGLMGDHSLVSLLNSHEDLKELKTSDTLVRLLARSIQARTELLNNNGHSENRALGFGKTIGNAILQVSRNRAKYHEAMTAGILVESFLADRSGIPGKEIREKIRHVMDRYVLKSASIKELGMENIIKTLNERYQLEHRNLVFSVPEEIGSPAEFEMNLERLTSGLRAYTEQYEFTPL